MSKAYRRNFSSFLTTHSLFSWFSNEMPCFSDIQLQLQHEGKEPFDMLFSQFLAATVFQVHEEQF